MMAFGMATTAFAADWTVYQGNDNHNGVVTNAPITNAASVSTIALTKNGSGWDGVDNVPVMQTVGANTYAYVLYDGYAVNGDQGGARLAKINCNAGSEVWNVQVGTNSGFQLSTPLLVQGADSASENDDSIFAAVQVSGGSKIVKVTDLGNATPTVNDFKTGITGQINTPVTKYGEYIYFGTWIGNGSIEGSNAPGAYYQVKHNDASDTQSMPSISKGFYWTGAVAVGNELYFGGDGGYLYHRTMGSGFGTSTNAEVYESAITLPAISGNAAGDVRSTVCLNGNKLYFTSKGAGSNGNLYCYDVATATAPTFSWGAKLAGTCTSTPTVAKNGNIYVGYYSGFNAGGIQKVMAPTSGSEGSVVTLNPTGWNQPVQCSPLVRTVGPNDYIFVNTNSGTGAGYCFKVGSSVTAANQATQVWSTPANTYALGGMACSNGYIVFGNDYNNLYIVH